MAEPISWQAIEGIVALLAMIRTANGYFTDIGALAETEPFQGEETEPNLAVLATAFEPKEGKSSNRLRREDMQVTIEFSVPITEKGAQQLAHRGLYDIRKALGYTGRNLPNSTFGLTVTSAQILPRPDGASSTVAQVVARIGLEERLATASSQES
ncbi:hypothetical protein [Arenimonas oryziterrae]|uniref:Uncharacterized protein n=1 Tax=Arenimonas oryziterrae DSM 21050 = YC6267 TaxID=1121015 RepID=A0A091ATK4_9GAMM|nr:hypothetical protein [Arenimonas oryziterrae]KFN42339.1 hypothetical protein N789_14210 [Arenimonas oryziterrae DSM 21050 = YC6267]